MYSSSRKRCPKTKWALKLLTAAFLAASPAAKSAVNNAYDALGNDSNLLIVFYVQIMPDDFVMQLHRF